MRESYPDRPETGPALSRILLDQIAAGTRPATVRLTRPGRMIAFGRRDTLSPGYRGAVAAAREAGFDGIERLTGGRVAAHSEGTLILVITTPESTPAAATMARFRIGSEMIRSAVADLGVDARTGPVPGEYCPGDYSVNAGGRIKLAGISQRMIAGAVHVGFVIVVSGSGVIRSVLDPVQRALGLDWDPATVGSIEDVLPGVTTEVVEEALLARLRRDSILDPVKLDPETRRLAGEQAGRFRSPGTETAGRGRDRSKVEP